jgi:hypothetical protein
MKRPTAISRICFLSIEGWAAKSKPSEIADEREARQHDARLDPPLILTADLAPGRRLTQVPRARGRARELSEGKCQLSMPPCRDRIGNHPGGELTLQSGCPAGPHARHEWKPEGNSITEGIANNYETGNLVGFAPDGQYQITDAEMLPVLFDLVTEEARQDAAAARWQAAERIGEPLGSGPG